MNTGAQLLGLDEAEQRVLHFQRELHDWASVDAERRFHDLWNLVCDPATLLVAWSRVSRNRGSRTAGIDGKTRSHVEREHGVERFLEGLRSELKSGEFRPLPVRERMIPKRDGRTRRLGDPDGQGIPRGCPTGLWVRWWSRIRFIRFMVSGLRCCSCVVGAPVACMCVQPGGWAASRCRRTRRTVGLSRRLGR